MPGGTRRRKKRRSELRNLLEFAGVVCGASALRSLPPRLAVRFCGAVSGVLLSRVLRRHRRRAFENLTRVFGDTLPDSEKRRLVHRVFEGLGRTAAEFALVPRLGLEAFHVTPDPATEQIRRRLLATGRPVIFVQAHLGAWEILAMKASSLGFPLHAAARPIDNPRLDSWVRSVRQTGDCQKVNIEKEFYSYTVDALNHGYSVGCMGDQARRHRPIFVPFLGIPAATTRLPALLALKTGAPLVPVCAPRVATDFEYALHFGEPIYGSSQAPLEEELVRLTRSFTLVLEGWIRRYPDQWLWTHRRWKVSREAVAESLRASYVP